MTMPDFLLLSDLPKCISAIIKVFFSSQKRHRSGETQKVLFWIICGIGFCIGVSKSTANIFGRVKVWPHGCDNLKCTRPHLSFLIFQLLQRLICCLFLYPILVFNDNCMIETNAPPALFHVYGFWPDKLKLVKLRDACIYRKSVLL